MQVTKEMCVLSLARSGGVSGAIPIYFRFPTNPRRVNINATMVKYVVCRCSARLVLFMVGSSAYTISHSMYVYLIRVCVYIMINMIRVLYVCVYNMIKS